MAIIKDYRGEWDVASVKVNFSNGDQRIYSGCKPLIVPNNYKYTKTLEKGSIVSIEEKRYRVLNLNGTIAEVQAQYNVGQHQIGNTSYGYYFDTECDTYLTNNFYESLSTNIKNAIIPKIISQDSWGYYGDDSNKFTAVSKEGTYLLYKLADVYKYGDYVGTAERNCYVISISDIIAYLNATSTMTETDTTLTYNNVASIFGLDAGIDLLGLRTEGNSTSMHAPALYGYFIDTGKFYYYNSSQFPYIFPAFQIDLDKIDWSIV